MTSEPSGLERAIFRRKALTVANLNYSIGLAWLSLQVLIARLSERYSALLSVALAVPMVTLYLIIALRERGKGRVAFKLRRTRSAALAAASAAGILALSVLASALLAGMNIAIGGMFAIAAPLMAVSVILSWYLGSIAVIAKASAFVFVFMLVKSLEPGIGSPLVLPVSLLIVSSVCILFDVTRKAADR